VADGIQPEATGPVLEVHDVSKTYSGVTVLRNVDLAIDRGTIRALLGQNGSGKSTLIKVLAGAVDPDPGGWVRIDGRPLRLGHPEESRAAGLRFVHQDLCLVESLSAVENVALTNGYLGGAARAINWKHERQRVEALLAPFDADFDVRVPIARFRRVEHSILAIARALEEGSTPIRLLVLDEPTAALPPPEVDRLFEVLHRVRARGIAVIYVSHRLDEIFKIADDVTILRNGRLQMTCATKDISPEELTRAVVGEVEEQTDVARVGARAVPVGAGIDQDAPRLPGAPGERQTPVLEVEGLTASMLRGVDFSVRPGEIVGIAGLAGSGREEVGEAVVGACPGSVRRLAVNGRELDRPLTPRLASAVGAALVKSSWSDGGAIKPMTIRENLTLASLGKFGALGRLSLRRERAEVGTWSRRMRIVMRDSEQALAHLSGGNQQKVVIAKWMSTQANVLFFDEPTTGVDVGAKVELHALMREFVEAGNAVVIASSDSVDFVGVCSRVIVLRNGVVAGELVGEEIEEGAIQQAIMGIGPATPMAS